jgi:hypothetical protein
MRGSKGLGRAAVVFGVLGILAVPVAVAAAQELSQVTLLQGLYVGAPISVGCGLLALLLIRRARLAAARSVTGGGPLRLGRVAAWAGLYVGVTAVVALGVYGVLVSSQ